MPSYTVVTSETSQIWDNHGADRSAIERLRVDPNRPQ